MAVLLLVGIADAQPVYPVKVGPTGRYLVDQNGVPFLMAGESPQALIGNISEADAELFFINRRAHGFNTVLIDLICAEYTGCRPTSANGATFDGIPAFTGRINGMPDFATPNEAYFARADRILQLAAQYGLLVLLDPAETGSWLDVMQANGVSRSRDFGRYVGNRYRNFDNILWFHGNDYGPPHFDLSAANDALVTAVALGIKDVDDRHLHTVLFNTNSTLPPVLSTDNVRWLPIIGLNAAYSYQATHVNVLDGYNYAPPMPVFMAETGYEFEDLAVFGTAPRNLRAQEYWTLLSGATGQVYGNKFTWPFLDGWQDQLDSPGAVQMAYLMALFSPRRWYDLVPDQSHTFVTANYGTIGQQDYVTAAKTTDGALALAYVPSSRTITVTMSAMAGSTTARWYDPASGSFVTITGSPFANSGSRDFTTPGTNADGPGNTDWVLVLEVLGPQTPTITSLTPSQVAVGGSPFTLTVTGTTFSAASTVRVNASDRVTTFVSATQLTATVDAADIAVAGTLSVTVSTPSAPLSNGVSLSVQNPLPTVVSLSPGSASAAGGGFPLTVTGTNFVASSIVRWNGVNRATAFGSATSLTATIPAGDIATAGTFAVTVVTPTPGGGTSAPASFSVLNPAPTLSSVSPSTATAGGSAFTLTVSGASFLPSSVVRWNGASRTTTFTDSGTLTATIPASDIATAGSASITVFTPTPGGGTSTAASLSIQNPAPTIASLSPNTVSVGGIGFTLTVTGSNFVSSSVVQWNGVNRTTTFGGATTLNATLPASDLTMAGPAAVTVLTPAPGGGTSSAISLAILNPAPTVTTLAPSTAIVGAAGFPLTVNGTSFLASSVVRWNGSDRTTTLVNATRLTALVPASDLATAGPAAITVFTPAPGGGTSGPANLSVLNPAPTVSGISPSSVGVGSGSFTLTITGANFLPSSVVQCDGVDQVTTFGSSTTLTATILASDLAVAGAMAVTVTTPAPGGGASAAVNLAVLNPSPTVTGLAPSSVTVGSGGLTLTVTGINFVASSVVRWNGAVRPTALVSPTELSATIPASDLAAAGSAAVSVVTPAPGGGASTTVSLPVLNPAPNVASLSPSTVGVGAAGFTLTVTGSSFVPSSVVQWNGVNRTTSFGNAATLFATIPATDLSVTGSAAITVVTPAPGGGTSAVTTLPIVNPAPTVTGLAPSAATVGGAGFTLTLSGANFVGSSVVQWNGTNRATTFGSSTTLTAAIPASDLITAGAATVTVVTPAPGGGTSAATLLVQNPAPTVTGVSPSSIGVGAAGITLTVTGTSFVQSSTVQWNGASRATTFGNATTLGAVIPASDLAAAGSAAITVVTPAPGGGASAGTNVSILNPLPTLGGLSPSTATVGGASFTLTVTGGSFLPSSIVRWNGADRTTTFVSSATLTAVIPTGDLTTPGSATITVVTPAPGGGTSGSASLLVLNPAPSVTGLSPSVVTAGGAGFTLTVTGADFLPGSVIQWNGATRATTYVSPTTLNATIAAPDLVLAETVAITVVTPAPGGGTSAAASLAVVNPLPAITALGPVTATIGSGGFVLTVTGTSFVPSSVVQWNGAPRATTFVSPSIVSATIPATDLTTAGNVSITVASPGPGGGTSAAATLSVLNPVPTVSSFNPGSVTVASADFTLTVTGSNFLASSVVRWNGADRATAFVSPTTLNAAIPASDLTTAGPVSITVVTSAPGGGASGAASFSVLNPVPAVSSLDPSSATVPAAGFTLTVTGTGFVSSSAVRWNGAVRPTTFLGPTTLSATIPDTDLTTVGSASITVATPAPGGGASTAASLALLGPLPLVSGINPSTATMGAAGFTLTVTGSDFLSSSVVRWNGTSRATTFISATQLTATILASDVATAGTALISVLTPAPGGGVSASAAFTIASPPPGAATLIAPSGVVTTTTPAFSWHAVSAATDYMLSVDDSTGNRIQQWYTATAVGCASGTGSCSVAPGVVMTGAGQWRVMTANASGNGTWSNALAFTVAPAATSAYPVKVGPTGRYLVDQNGVPFLMAGESPQAMIGNISEADAELFFANRRALGFNTVIVDLLCAAYTGCRPDTALGVTFDGIPPFTGQVNGAPDFSTPNEAYFAHADRVLQLAAQYGFLVLLDPAETGSWLTVMQANGVAQSREYGRYLGQRYRSFDNIVWFHGNDYGPPHADLSEANDALVTAIALGIKELDDRHLHTVLFNTNTPLPPVLSTDNARWLPIIDINAAYTYQTTHEVVLAGYNYAAPMPVFLAEAGYEGEDIARFGSTPCSLRAQEYWSLLSGASGQIFGNTYTWRFIDGWKDQLNTRGAIQMAYLTALFSSRRWYDLVPDQSHAVVTAGFGTFAQPDYVTAARTPDGGLVMAYVPSTRTITVDLSTMAGTTTARWYDPANGSFAAIAGSPFTNSGSRSFTTPGNNADGPGNTDWVLVLEAQASPIAALATISPGEVNLGGSDFTLTVNGTNFDPTSVVRVNGSARPTLFASVTRLTATIPAADIASAGTLSIQVFTPGAGVSNALPLSVRYPVPSLNTISPARILMGGSGFTLTVTGTSFVPSSVVRWKGTPRPTTFVSPTVLTADIPPGDIAVAGAAAVAVFNSLPGGGTSMTARFTVDAPGRVAFSSATAAVNETAAAVTLTVTRTLGVGGPVMVDYATADGTAHASDDYDAISGTLTFATLETTKTLVVPVHSTVGGANKTFTVTLSNPQAGLALIAPTTATVTVRDIVSTLTSFSPSQGPIGTVITVSGTNLDLATGVQFFNDVTASSVTIMTPTSIRTTVPAGATTGPISVMGPAGNPSSVAVFKVTPRITSLTPDDGILGTLVTIKGTSFTNASAVRFGSVAGIDSHVVDDTTITTTVPAAATTAPVTVTTPGGTATSPAPFVVIKAPTISSFSPAVGAEGALVTLNGTNLASVTGVTFTSAGGSLNASPVTVVSATSLRVVVPAGAITGRLGVANPAGTATSATDFRVAPRIVSVTPAQATPGTIVTLAGAAFAGATSVKFGSIPVAPLSFTVASNNSITATVPPTAVTARITVTTSAATATSPADFIVIRPPTIGSFTPVLGPIGATITITGTNLASVTSVSFTGANASSVTALSVTVLSATSLRVVVPAFATTGKISVGTDSVGSATSTGSFSVTPSIEAVQPARGLPGVTLITITGRAFAGATAVRFGSVTVVPTLIASTQVTATVPASAVTGPVSVVTPSGTATSTAPFMVVRAPTITSVSPARGPVGAAVTLSGANLGTVTTVDFSGTAVSSITVLSATSVRVVVPAGASSGRIHASNEVNQASPATSAADFVLTPQLVSMSPGRGLPGDTVVLTGTSFTGATLVRFGSVPAATPVQVDSSGTQITTQVPASALTGKISVTTPTGTTTATTNFVVIRPPTLMSFTPASGPEGTLVTLSGANIAGVNQVAFGAANATSITVLSPTMVRVVVPPGATTAKIAVADEVSSGQSAATFTVTPRVVTIPAAALPGAGVTIRGTSLTNASAVRFGGIAAPFTVDSPTQITATVPPNGVSGKITVTTPGGTATSATDFTVIRPPTLTSFSPASGQVGTPVTLTGTNLGTVTAVAFGNVSVTAPITVLSASSIQLIVPQGAVTGHITVTNPAASAQSGTSFTLVPRITGLSAPSGADDSVVSILGSSFTGVTAVKFGAVSATFTLVSDGEISAVIPAAAVTGRVSVTTPGGTATSPADFVITAALAF